MQKIKAILEALVAKEAIESVEPKEYTVIYRIPVDVYVGVNAMSEDEAAEIAQEAMSLMSNLQVDARNDGSFNYINLEWVEQYENELISVEQTSFDSSEFDLDDEGYRQERQELSDMDEMDDLDIMESEKPAPLVKKNNKTAKVKQELPKKTVKAPKVQTTLEAEDGSEFIPDREISVRVETDIKPTRSGRKEIVKIWHNQRLLGEGTYSWSNRPWQEGTYDSATRSAVADMKGRIPADVFAEVEDIMAFGQSVTDKHDKLIQYLSNVL